MAEAAVIGAVWGALASTPARARHELHHAAVAVSLLSAGYFVARCHAYHHGGSRP